jgi:hypothetical protein
MQYRLAASCPPICSWLDCPVTQKTEVLVKEVESLRSSFRKVSIAQAKRLTALQEDAMAMKTEASAVAKESRGIHQLMHTVLIGHQVRVLLIVQFVLPAGWLADYANPNELK